MKVLEINSNDLIHNIKMVKRLAQDKEEQIKCEIIGVVKGNGYGFGLVEFTRFLSDQGIKMFAVATVDEAIELRKAGITEEILMLSSTSCEEDVKLLIENNITLSIGSKEAAEVAEKLADKKINVHIKIDTGFGRYGFLYNDIATLVEVIKSFDKLQIVGCFSHFSDAYSPKPKWTSLQFDRFLSVVENLKLNNIEPGMLHICNSSAFFKYPYMILNAVRIGSAFTGRLSIPNRYGLKRVGKFKASISEIKTLPKGHNVGYSNTCKIKRKTRVAIVPVGYMDGIHMDIKDDTFRVSDHMRHIFHNIKAMKRPPKLMVTIKDKQYKTLGMIGMYHIVVDIGNDNISVGEIVEIDAKPLFINNKIRREYSK